uniref:Uncharacterized protein n=1 Tax=Octactis speculum TaxID=3111310 RepID=A0A7S2B841_9STRA|mmetsp:Transcript_20581/g.27942  ORF Transcript_20581/g.27942 Transcript_20581/m.27942 type:complete len:115 (+) Transcript_20581:51-395(+)
MIPTRTFSAFFLLAVSSILSWNHPLSLVNAQSGHYNLDHERAHRDVKNMIREDREDHRKKLSDSKRKRDELSRKKKKKKADETMKKVKSKIEKTKKNTEKIKQNHRKHPHSRDL